MRTQIEAFEWMEKKFDMRIIKVKMNEPKNYHFDTVFFPLTPEKVIACTCQMEKSEIAEIEKVAEIIPVPKKLQFAGATNCVRTSNMLLVDSSRLSLKKGSAEWETEVAKEDFLQKVAIDNGMSLVPISMVEMSKSGSCLSCCVLHMNRAAYSQPIV